MQRSDLEYLYDLQTAAAEIQEFTAGHSTFSEFSSDTMCLRAVERNFLLIGEAVKGLGPETRALEPDIPWTRIAGLRDMLAHAYFNVDPALLWDIVIHHLPALAEAAIRMQQSLEGE
jgi:uncharacterized protein with HEPN domain